MRRSAASSSPDSPARFPLPTDPRTSPCVVDRHRPSTHDRVAARTTDQALAPEGRACATITATRRRVIARRRRRLVPDRSHVIEGLAARKRRTRPRGRPRPASGRSCPRPGTLSPSPGRRPPVPKTPRTSADRVVDPGFPMRVISWNIAGREEPWRDLAPGGFDVALLQEAKRPPADVEARVDDRP